MSLPGRSGRRGGAGYRWIAAGVVITLFVLLIDASLNSRSPSTSQSVSAGSWVDRVLPVIATSNAEGRELAGVWSPTPAQPAAQRLSSMSDIAAGSAKLYSTVVALQPPAELGGAAGLLDAALLARSRAAAGLEQALSTALGPGGTSPPDASAAGAATAAQSTTSTTSPTAEAVSAVIPDVTGAGAQIQVGDQAYQLFLSTVPKSLGVTFPASAWDGANSPYSAAAAQTLLTTLQNSVVTTPVAQVKVYALTTSPAPVSTIGATEVLPDSASMNLDVTVANTGNQPLSNLTVTAAIAPAGSGAASVRDFVNLGVGQAYTVTGMGPLNPPQGVPVTLTVTVSGPASLRSTPASLVFEMPGATPLTTTSTTSTTLPAITTPTTTVAGATPPTT